MAASLSRPDPSSPASVAEAGFSTSRRGYHPDEVRAFLTSVAAELGRMKERERLLEAQLLEARTVTPDLVELDDAMIARALGEETLRVLHTARESASEIKIRAEENAARTLHEASEEANRMRQDAEVEAARKRQDASSDAEAEVALAKQQGREMVNEARAYRERVLADLERRTTLARHQIEELLHGRDRLLQVFERARLVAVDVTSGLQDVDAPTELVNLSPTTGPVPVMVPQERPERVPRPDVDEAIAADDATTPRETTDELDHTHSEVGDIADADALEDAETEESETEEAETGEHAGEPGSAETQLDDETAATAETEQTEAPDTDLVTAPATDANVVSLFRGRAVPVLADDEEIIDDTDDVDDALPTRDVGGIFERLRHGVTEPPAIAAAADHVTRATSDTDLEEAAEEAVGDEVRSNEPTAFSRRDEAIVPLIVAAARKLKRVLADEQNGVLDTLRQGEPIVAVGQLVPYDDDHVIAYLEALSDELLEASVAGARETGVDDTKTLRRKLVSTGALDRAHALVRTDLIAPLRDRLERAIAAGDGDNEEITKRVRSVYREWKTQHIDDQLDDVFRFAHGGGLFNAIAVGDPVVWVIDPSEPACPDCEDNSLAGSVAAGDAFPTGHSCTPAHPGCRCLTLPEAQ